MTENHTTKAPQDRPLVPLFHTILAAQNKTSELFVKSFQYQGENIATKHLGQIFGFFEIPDTHEDNAYIVNFLASVVKKEYFVNPKRSATDAFEAALHKVNLALTELVKQGNTEWLGKLHGVVSVIENNNFHFSVTGDAAILLYRDSQVTLISEGLADKDAAVHPLKTFLEISSGVLHLQDKILITSPELFTLCNPETLRKNAFRMDKNGFARYVRAALVNELPLGVSIIIDLEPAPAIARPKKKASALREESREKLQNIFSNTPFMENTLSEKVVEESVAAEEEIEPTITDYTDKKTGHIYVQGEVNHDLYHEPSSWQTFREEYVLPFFSAFAQIVRRFTKKSRKTVAKNAAALGAGSKVVSQNLWKLSKEKSALLATRSNQALQARLKALKDKRTEKSERPPFESFTMPEEVTPLTINAPDELSEPEVLTQRQKTLARFSPGYEYSPLSLHPTTKSPSLFRARITSSFSGLIAKVQKFSLKQKLIIGSIAVVIIGASVFFLVGSPATVTEHQEGGTPTPETSIQNQEPVATSPQLTDASTKANWTDGEGLLVVSTEDATVVVAPKSVIFNGQNIPFVANGNIESAAYMPDLRMIFLWSSANELVSWSLVDRKFTANTFPLPAGVQVEMLGAYLTYLYVLDTNAGTIYRFARTEGGFSEPTSWLKTPLPKGSAKAFSINDTIRIASATTDQYLRGVKEKTLSNQSYQVMGASDQRNFTLGIQTESGKLTVWNVDGNMVYEGTHEELKGVTAVTYNENTKKLLVTKGQNLIEYSLSW